MVDGAQLTLKRSEPQHWHILAEFASAFGGSEKIAHLELRDGELAFAWEPLKNPDQRVHGANCAIICCSSKRAASASTCVAPQPVRAHPLTISFATKPAESKWQIDGPPGGSYSAVFQAGTTLALVAREHSLAVTLRSEPAAAPFNWPLKSRHPRSSASKYCTAESTARCG